MTDQPALPAPDFLDFTPVPRKILRRHDGWTAERQRALIDALAATGSVSAAARAVGVSNASCYNLYNHPEAASLRRAWDRALEVGTTRIHDAAIERAVDGIAVPVFYKGEQIGEQRRYSDRVLTTLLRHHSLGHHPSPVGNRSRATIERQAKENCPVCRARREAEEAAAARLPGIENNETFMLALLRQYAIKVTSERRARLDGNIVGADFALRQLTYLELVLDCAGGSGEAFALWTGIVTPADLAAIRPSEIATDLAEARQAVWAREAAPPRPLHAHDPDGTRPTSTNGGPTITDRSHAQKEARRRIAEGQAMWEAAATEEGWAAWCARE